MPKTVIQYDLLISCPSDVEDELAIINETVEDFNRMFGSANNIQVITKHWSKDSYPQSGGSPQSLLNSQFIFDCDAALAVFWTRFGTPTEEYGSGTEEEIEELIKSGKQVFLYFSDRPTNPSSLDSEQYNKVTEFRKKYSSQGIYHPYSDLAVFKKELLNHLTLYFLKMITNENAEKDEINRSKLSIKGTLNGKITEEKIIATEKDYLNAPLLTSLTNDISEIFNKYKNNPLVIKPEEKSTLNTSLNEKYINSSIGNWASLLEVQPVRIENLIMVEIQEYAKKQNIEIREDLFYLGDLGRKKNLAPLQNVGHSYTLVGTEEEKEKYDRIKNLYFKIVEFQEWSDFFNKLSSFLYVELALTNFGSSFDEDIDISLYIPKGHLQKADEIPVPGNGIIELITEHIDSFFKPKKSVAVKEYENYPSSTSYFTPSFPVLPISQKEEVDRNRQKYEEVIEELFCYEYFSEEKFDVVRFTQPYLKQNSNVFFPSILLLKTKPDCVYYEISSKFSPEVIKDEIVVSFDRENQ